MSSSQVSLFFPLKQNAVKSNLNVKDGCCSLVTITFRHLPQIINSNSSSDGMAWWNNNTSNLWNCSRGNCTESWLCLSAAESVKLSSVWRAAELYCEIISDLIHLLKSQNVTADVNRNNYLLAQWCHTQSWWNWEGWMVTMPPHILMSLWTKGKHF